MLERITQRARQALFTARYYAAQTGARFVRTEHLLRALLREPLALDDLVRTDSLQRLRFDLERRQPAVAGLPESGDVPLSPNASHALQLSADEADRLHHEDIDYDHLVLGILRVPDSESAKALTRFGVTLDGLREAVARRARRQELIRLIEELPDSSLDAARQALKGL
jgi:ATP-dependent Clp protease ATP-binding subunit ClpC